jgi:hypothetical protein
MLVGAGPASECQSVMPMQPSIPVHGAPSTDGAARPLPLAILGWLVVLAIFPVFAFWFLPSLRRTSGSTDPLITAVFWASLVIVLRALIALLLRDRSRWWILYVLAYPLLVFVAGAIAEWKDFSVLWR